jgi:HD-GYP domain-containing protein (c-di-GMP phosphodiesterase class II)
MPTNKTTTKTRTQQVRLHPCHTERVLSRSPFLSALAPVASAHHEPLDGSGYHRGAAGAELTLPARVLAAADSYRAMTEPRPYRKIGVSTRAGASLFAMEHGLHGENSRLPGQRTAPRVHLRSERPRPRR